MKRFDFDIRVGQSVRRAQALAYEWQERTERVRRVLAQRAAFQVKDSISQRLDGMENLTSYQKSLDVAEIKGMAEGVAGYVLRSDVQSRAVRKLDAPKTVVYVQPKRELRRTKPEIIVLQKFSPWTLATLPFMPSRNDALVLTRKVSRGEVAEVEKFRIRDRVKWRKALDQVGFREGSKDRRVRLSVTARAIPDVAFEALRVEFGLGQKSQPHWKPAIRKLIRGGIRHIVREDPELRWAFTRLQFQGWRRWPKKVRSKIRVGEARNYLPFQKKLGIRI